MTRTSSTYLLIYINDFELHIKYFPFFTIRFGVCRRFQAIAPHLEETLSNSLPSCLSYWLSAFLAPALDGQAISRIFYY